MARIRTIKPEFWHNEILARLPAETRLLAIALLNHADDHGYFWASAQLVRAACFPFDEDSTNVRRALDELSTAGWIERRIAPDGRHVGVVCKFAVHQRVDRPQHSKIKQIFNVSEPFDERSTNDRRMLDDRSLLEQGTGNREQGTGITSASADVCPESRRKRRASDRQQDDSEIVMTFECNGDPETWNLHESRVSRWRQTFPGVEVEAELLKAQTWLADNPTRRKTAGGMAKFLNGWLSRCQNQGPSRRAGRAQTGKPTEEPLFTPDALAWAMEGHEYE